MSFLSLIYAGSVAPPPDTTPPNDVTGFTATLSGTQVILDSDPAVDPAGNGIQGYHTQSSLNGTFSDAVDLLFSTTTQQIFQGTPGTTPFFRRKAHKANGLESADWVASTPTSVTIPNTLAADTTNPLTPAAAPTLITHDSVNITLALPVVADSTVNSATQIVSGVVRYLLKRNGTLLPSTYPNPSGILAAIESVTIGSPAIPGSYNLTTGVYTLVCGGENGWYGTTDQGRIASAPVQGDFTLVAKINSVTSAYTWEKCGVIVQDGLAANASYFSGIVFNNNGWNRESRASQGASATQDSLTSSLAAKPWVQLTRVGNLLTVSIAADVAGSPGSFTQLGTQQTIAMSSIVEVGLFCSAGSAGITTTAVFSNLTITGAATVVVHDTGSPSTTYLYTYAAQDVAGNIGTYSAALSVTTDSSGGAVDGSGLTQWAIGGQSTYDQSAVQDFLATCEHVTMGPFEGQTWPSTNWGAIVDSIHAKSLAIGLPVRAQIYYYYDSMYGGISSSVIATIFNKINANASWRLKSASGTPLNWAGSFQAVNFYPGSTNDSGGFNVSQWLARYFDNRSRTGNADGVLTGGTLSAADVDGAASDDNLTGFASSLVSQNGDWTRDGVADTPNATNSSNYRDGQKAVQQAIDIRFPAGKRWMNGIGIYNTTADIAQYVGWADVPMLENSLGDTGTYENFGYTNLTGAINKLLVCAKATVGRPALIHNSVGTNGQDVSSTNGIAAWRSQGWQAQRYGFAIALLYNMMYGANASATGAAYSPLANSALWLDEYCIINGVCQSFANRTGAGLRCRGPVQASAPTQLTSGVWTINYLKMKILVNPRGNGAQTLTLGGSTNYVAPTGTQSATVNNGAAIGPSTSITMPERSAKFLLNA